MAAVAAAVAAAARRSRSATAVFFQFLRLEHDLTIMLRFFSRRKPRGRAEQRGYEKAGGSASYARKANKNQLACRIILLDGADLSIDISVRHLTIYIIIFMGGTLSPNVFQTDKMI